MEDNYFVCTDGALEEHVPGEDVPRRVRFPLRLVVRPAWGNPVDYRNFVINTSESDVFIGTSRPLQVGSRVTMQFYIPPDVKLPGKFDGEVVWVNCREQETPKGMGVRLNSGVTRPMKHLEALLKERCPIIDYVIE